MRNDPRFKGETHPGYPYDRHEITGEVLKKESDVKQRETLRHLRDKDVKDKVCQMAVVVKGEVISDMKSFLARKKMEREHRSKNPVKTTGSSSDGMPASHRVKSENKSKSDTDVGGGQNIRNKSFGTFGTGPRQKSQ